MSTRERETERERERENLPVGNKLEQMKLKPQVFSIICHLPLQVKHAFVPCVMNTMQILCQFGVTLSDWNESCC